MSHTFEALTAGAQIDKRRVAATAKVFRESAEIAVDAATSDSKKPSASAAVLSSMGHVPLPPTLNIFHEDAFDTAAAETAQQREDPSKAGGGVKAMTAPKIGRLLKKHGISTKGADVPQPVTHFSELARAPLNLPAYVATNLFARDHKLPTPVQMIAIPALARGRHVLACAPTGSGKTVAFLVPLLAALQAPDREAGIRAVVVSPTKELAVQIERELFFLIRGGRWRLVQHGQSTKGKDVFVTTPNRIVSMLKAGSGGKPALSLAAVKYIVFDEGDRLWDKESDNLQHMDAVLAACTNPDKTIALFSATLSDRVERLARTVMHDPLRVIVNSRAASSKDVEQRLLFVGSELGKIIAMRNMLREGVKPPVLVFVQSIERTKELLEEIQTAGVRVALMNSKMTADERDETVLQFRLGRIWMLITTELLSRGMDFKSVGTVINFDMPLSVESYIHRVGRTGRAGHKGLAITFFTEDDKERLPPIAAAIKESGSAVDDWIGTLAMPSKKRQRALEKTVPQRLVVSTQKRILIGEKRIDRQIKQAERERAAERKAGPEDDDYDYDSDEA
jgi:ATP-dependent RNA helicase DDX52/ROK1